MSVGVLLARAARSCAEVDTEVAPAGTTYAVGETGAAGPVEAAGGEAEGGGVGVGTGGGAGTEPGFGAARALTVQLATACADPTGFAARTTSGCGAAASPASASG